MNRCVWIALFTSLTVYGARTVHRLRVNELPAITVQSTTTNERRRLIDCNLRPVPLFSVFDKNHFMQHLLPTGTIMCNDGTIVESTLID